MRLPMNKLRFQHILIPAGILIFMILCIVGAFDNPDVSGVLAADETAVTGTPTPAATSSPAPTSDVTTTPTPTPASNITAIPASATPTENPDPTPVQDRPSDGAKMIAIVAYYSGDPVIIGQEYDMDKLTVFAYYDDNYSEQITDFSVTDKLVTQIDSNLYTVMAYGFTDTFYVKGKSVISISAEHSRYTYTVGNAPDERDVKVTAYYSDNTKDVVTEGFKISPSVFETAGSQEVTISYCEHETTFRVTVKEAADLKQLDVFYKGGDVYANMEISRSDLTVNAIYTDNSSERITTYELLTDVFPYAGDQKLTVAYRGQTASVTVLVHELELKSLRAKYTGDEVYIGTEYDPKYLYVYATYNNNKEIRTDAYKVYNKVIRYIGDNTIKIYLGDLSTSVTIVGCEVGEPDFTYVSTVSVNSNNYDITIDTAIPRILDTDVTAAKKMSKAKLKHLYRILGTKTENYLGFSYGFEDNNNEKYLPMAIRITLPEGFEPACTELYYSPNNKTILGCMNKMAIDDKTLQITIFKAGTYMLVYDPDKYVPEETPEDEEEEDED